MSDRFTQAALSPGMWRDNVDNIFTVTPDLSVYLLVPRGKRQLKTPIFVQNQEVAKQNLIKSGSKIS